jgi:hypothetical protein
LISLPQRSSYLGIVSNTQKNVFAVNYHETGNFDSVDLIISDAQRIFVIPNLWIPLESKLKAEQVIPNVGYDRCYLSVKEISANHLTCSFTGYSRQLKGDGVVTKDFVIIARADQRSVMLTVAHN